MALSPEFNWLDNSDKISAQPAGNLYRGITRAGCLHVDFQGLGEVLRALDASSGAVQISYTSKYCATVFVCFSLISRCRDPAWARAHAEGLVVDVVDGRLALRSEDSYAINEVVGN